MDTDASPTTPASAPPDAAEGVPFAVGPDGTVAHPLVRAGVVRARAYQLELAARAAFESHVLVLPTGLGKTVVAALVAAEALRADPAGKVVVTAPTRPLVAQHGREFARILDLPPDAFATLTGSVPPARRAAEFRDARVVLSTPQGLANDVAKGRVDLSGVALLVVDECHRAVGDYAYVPLAAALRDARPEARVLGLTASPGGEPRRFRAVVESLGVARALSRDLDDPDVASYFPGLDVERRPVRLTDVQSESAGLLASAYDERTDTLKRMGFCPKSPGRVSKRALLAAGDTIRKRLGRSGGGFLFGAMHHQLVAIQLSHALELLETQGVDAFRAYVARVEEDDRRASRAFLKDPRVRQAREALRLSAAHPKETALLDVLREHEPARALVFTQYRDTVRTLVPLLRDAGWRTEPFVGQAARTLDDPGLAQAEQVARLDAFRRGELQVLVATSVAEEGLDVPDVDLVVFHEAVPSEIRSIQRRGRTGRSRIGKVVILVTEGTRDERALASAEQKERRMRKLVRGLGG